MRFHPTLLLLAALASGSATAIDHRVTVGGNALTFSPSNLTITAGDTVTFTNAGGLHNVHADNDSFRCAEGCDQSGGNGNPSGSSWSFTIPFNSPGDVPYSCDAHANLGMRGVIHVQQATTPPPPPANVPITSGFTGAWYDPAQSGHGIFIEVLPGNQMLAWWFAFNPDGTEQSWFGNVGTIDGDTAVVDAIMTTGGRWIPNFDPAATTAVPWGTLTFTFTDCNHGRVDFDSTVSGYGTGHMDLTRLTQPAGLTCP